MGTLSMKDTMTLGVRRIIAHGIIDQQKYILISEVVRIVFDHQDSLGINIFPPVTDPQEQHDRKYNITKTLNNLYDQYCGQDASLRDIVTDLLSKARQQGLTILVK